MPLHEYQERMVSFATDRLAGEGTRGVGLFADPGLGKTICSLEIIKRLKPRRALVLAPRRVVDMVWKEENQKFGYGFKISDIGKHHPNGADIELCSCDSTHKLVPLAGRWDLVIVDESPKYKGWTTRRMKSLRKLLPSLPKRIILTGTPTPHSLADLHSQMFIVDDGESLGKNVTVFRARFMTKGGWQGREWLLRHGVEDEIYELIGNKCLRLDAESNISMPELIVNDIWVELPSEAQQAHKDMKKRLLAELESGDILAMNSAGAYHKLRQIANGTVYDEEKNVHICHSEKITALENLYEELMGKQLLTFYQFRSEIPIITKALGSCTDDLKKWLGKKYQNMLAHPQSLGHGVNAQVSGCRDVAFLGLGDSAGDYEQAYRRIYRQGANGCVRVHRILCRGSIDEVILDRQNGKLETQSEFLNALKRFASS